MVKPQSGLKAIRPYVPGKPIEEVQREYGLTDIIKLASNENPIGASPVVLRALAEALPRLNLYPDAQAFSLRCALAAHHGVDAEMIRVGNGADGVIRELCVSYLEDGDEMLTSCSSFPVYDISAAVMRARIIKTPLTPDLRFDLRALADAVTPRTRLIFVCNPNNPTGSIVTAAEVAEFMARVPDSAIVVFDEAYYEFVDDPQFPDTMQYVLEGRKNVCILRTFSKAYGIAGIRIGYAIASTELLTPLRACSESFPVNLLAQVAGEAALRDPAFLQRTVAVNAEGRVQLTREFARLGIPTVSSQTNFILARVGPRAKRIYEELLKRGVIVRPCTGYDLPEHLRITIGDRQQNERLIATLRIVIEELTAVPV
ncbi:MAG: histidinol-phosphate transaminase [Anaerolineae bacterium]|jgi:histidinol-phosphate aminotransferase|nr:histidinol-phosphate transaminase [Anaerolineae bacterium]